MWGGQDRDGNNMAWLVSGVDRTGRPQPGRVSVWGGQERDGHNLAGLVSGVDRRGMATTWQG